MIRLSIPLRQALARLSLPLLIAGAFGTMLLGKADTLLVERARMTLADALSPIWGAVQQPVQATRDAMEAGNTTVVVHAFSAEQRDQAADLLRAIGGETTSTL